MEVKEIWDFECPQYVDFQRELDSIGKDDIYFDSKTKNLENESLCTPEVQGKGKGLTESDENRLLNKMTAALSLLENTPKIKKSASRRKLYPDTELISKTVSSNITKSTVKPSTVPAPHLKSRRSRSLDHLHKIISGKANKVKKCGLRKSSSLNDLRSYNKLKYPITPMCLKRTIFKAKEKIIKTTEEMELEKIARLQKQLIEHLRQNEISLKKLNLRPRQCAASKTLLKCVTSKDIKGVNALAEKSNVVEKEQRRNIRMLNQAAVKREASKLDTIINGENVTSKKTENTICSRRPKAVSVSTVNSDVNIQSLAAVKKCLQVDDEVASYKKPNTMNSRNAKSLSVSVIDSEVNKTTIQKAKKLTHKRILDHSGLMFIPSMKSNSNVRPFIFEEKMKEIKTQVASAKQKEMSAILRVSKDKENNGCVRPQLVKKSQRSQNAKCDISKLDESNKITEKRIANPMRGVPLAENLSRD